MLDAQARLFLRFHTGDASSMIDYSNIFKLHVWSQYTETPNFITTLQALLRVWLTLTSLPWESNGLQSHAPMLGKLSISALLSFENDVYGNLKRGGKNTHFVL